MTSRPRLLGAVLCWSTLFLLPLLPAQAAPAEAGAPSAATTCRPQPGKNPCEGCHENNCCEQRRACEADAACAAFVECIRSGCPTPPCLGSCGRPPKLYVERYSCQMARCNVSACGGPIDACTLCAATRCTTEVLACQGQPACAEYTFRLENCKGNASCRALCKKPTAEAGRRAEAQASCEMKLCEPQCRATPKP
jgi:hypothetical protein